MAVFLVFGIVLAAALFQGKQIGWKILTGLVAAACATVALAEVKIFFIALPLGLILLFRWKLVANPAKTIGPCLLKLPQHQLNALPEGIGAGLCWR